MDLTSISTIRPLMERHGFDFTKSLGQNFLINPDIPRRIAEAGVEGIEGECDVIEVGAGIGCLTKELALRARRVITFEIDKKLIPVLEETMAEYENVTVLNQDVMKADIPAIMEQYGLKNVCICANLPYYITTPVVMKLLEEVPNIKKITIMIQKEVVDRFCAEPGTADYGSVTAAVAYYSVPKKLFQVSAANFMPRPKVTSTVMTLTPCEPPVNADKNTLFRVIKAAFAMRRKTLANNLCQEFPISKADAGDLLLSLGYSATVRGEALSLSDYARIADALCEKQ